MTKIFISYAWGDDVKIWVKEFADKLKSDGVEVHFDQDDVKPGDRLPKFMEEQIIVADYVLIICTPMYKKKADKRTGGVGYEGHIISSELMNSYNERKFIPIKRKGASKNAIPRFLAGKSYVDLSAHGSQYEHNYQKLVTWLLGKNNNATEQIKTVTYTNSDNDSSTEIDEPIRILEIITNQITIPKMDGTHGSALYDIPFRLSRKPSTTWIKFFIQSWNNPPRCTTMHRPGIASVYNDKIILKGTNIEEVKAYHQETLVLCIEQANKKEAEIIEKKRQDLALAKQQQEQHLSNINQIATTIKF